MALVGKFKIITMAQMAGNLLGVHGRRGWVVLAGDDQRWNIAADRGIFTGFRTGRPP